MARGCARGGCVPGNTDRQDGSGLAKANKASTESLAAPLSRVCCNTRRDLALRSLFQPTRCKPGVKERARARKGEEERISVLAQFMILWVCNIIFRLVLDFRWISKTNKKEHWFYSIWLQIYIIKFKSEVVTKGEKLSKTLDAKLAEALALGCCADARAGRQRTGRADTPCARPDFAARRLSRGCHPLLQRCSVPIGSHAVGQARPGL